MLNPSHQVTAEGTETYLANKEETVLKENRPPQISNE